MSVRNIQDAALSVSKALPAANASASSASIDLGAVAPGISVDDIEAQFSLPATPDLTDSLAITTTFEDSADDSSFTAIPELATVVVTGVPTSAGGPATTRTVRLPGSVRRYLRFTSAVASGGGSNIAVSGTLKLLF